MDDIYNDLDNFNDVNIVEELKHENKELKFKLEEYSSAMHQLQKDFDKLNSEYKNLERNYSSLLKTARAEIERKTDTIKNLNLEKDKLVLNSLQKGKNILHNKFNYKDQNKKSTDPNPSIKEVKKIKESDNRLQVNRQQSVDTVSSIPTDCQSARSENKILKTGFENKIPKEDCIRGRDERDKYTKDNVQDGPSVRKVTDRRKSVPSFGECEPTFSSDEDSRKTMEPQPRDLPPAGEDVRHFDRHYKQQESDYYHPYRSRGNKYEFERQRNYECYDKPRRYFSPDNHQRYGREFSDNYNQRDYRDKRRVERSPPLERYSSSKRDRRYNYERENYRDHSRHTNEHVHMPSKNKSRFELEEPLSKRPKVESHNRHIEHFNNEKERHTIKLQETSECPSCQSPDYLNIDANTLHHPVKEIRHTALVPLPDPRLLSNKYILKSNSEKPILATVAGCNVDIIPISNPTWGTQKFFNKSNSKGLDSEMYNNIGTFKKTPSLESGEIQSLDEDHCGTKYPNISDHEDNVKSTVSLPATKEVDKSFVNKYKIPRLKRQNVTKESNTQEQQDVSKKKFVKDFKVVVEGKHLSERYPEKYNSDLAYENCINNEKSESILQKLMDEKTLNENANATKYQKSDKIINISTIEGDLELSDETSDYMDLVKEDRSQNIMKDEKIDHLTKEDHTQSDSEKHKSRKNKSDDKVNKSKDSKKSSHSKRNSEHVKEKTRDSSKKRKNKQTGQEDLNDKEILAPKAKKKEKEKGKEKEIENKLDTVSPRKNKFTDLFGDSNSLITPDDLGISNVIPDKYVPVYEDTQDAVDLSGDMAIVKRKTENTNVEDTHQQISDDTIVNTENTNETNMSPPATYENTISDTDTSNVVKTVIISTGTQPETFPPNIAAEKELKTTLNTIKAFATSTPYKTLNPKEPQIVDPATINDSKNTKVDKTDDSKTQTVEKCETDVPDVRIFVKRRKKATKKST